MKTQSDFAEKVTPVTMTPIGIIHSPCSSREDTPKNGALRPDISATLEVDPRYREAMADIRPGQQVMILSLFHQSGPVRQTVPLRGSGPMTALFSTHAPSRPNPIGVSVITVTAVEDNRITFTGVDMFDKTPVLDIKSWSAH